MNSKKAKKIRNLLRRTYGDSYSEEIILTMYKKIKKNYSKLSKEEKISILKNAEDLISSVNKK